MRPGQRTRRTGPHAVATVSLHRSISARRDRCRRSRRRDPGRRAARPCARATGAPRSRAVGEQARESPAGARGEQVAAAVVEGLGGEGKRPVGARRLAPGVGDAGAHLHEAVEPAAVGPGASPSVRVVRHVDEIRIELRGGAPCRTRAARGRRRDSRGRARAPRARSRSKTARSPGSRRSRNARRLPAVISGRSAPTSSNPGGIDAQDVRAIRGEQARANRSGHDAREVEDADPGERQGGASRARSQRQVASSRRTAARSRRRCPADGRPTPLRIACAPRSRPRRRRRTRGPRRPSAHGGPRPRRASPRLRGREGPRRDDAGSWCAAGSIRPSRGSPPRWDPTRAGASSPPASGTARTGTRSTRDRDRRARDAQGPRSEGRAASRRPRSQRRPWRSRRSPRRRSKAIAARRRARGPGQAGRRGPPRSS